MAALQRTQLHSKGTRSSSAPQNGGLRHGSLSSPFPGSPSFQSAAGQHPIHELLKRTCHLTCRRPFRRIPSETALYNASTARTAPLQGHMLLVPLPRIRLLASSAVCGLLSSTVAAEHGADEALINADGERPDVEGRLRSHGITCAASEHHLWWAIRRRVAHQRLCPCRHRFLIRNLQWDSLVYTGRTLLYHRTGKYRSIRITSWLQKDQRSSYIRQTRPCTARYQRMNARAGGSRAGWTCKNKKIIIKLYTLV